MPRVGTSVVIVADAPDRGAGRTPSTRSRAGGSVGDPPVEIVWTSARLGHGAAMNIGIRRASAPVVILLDPSVEPTGDLVTPLVEALEDPTVAVAGGWGIVSGDLRKFEDAPAGDVDAIEGYVPGLPPGRRRRRAARSTSGSGSTATSTSGGASSCATRGTGSLRAGGGRRGLARRTRHEHRGWTSLPDAERDRQSKRNFYRIIDRFGSRLRPAPGPDASSLTQRRRTVRAVGPVDHVPAERLDPPAQRIGGGEVASRPCGIPAVDERGDLAGGRVVSAATASASHDAMQVQPEHGIRVERPASAARRPDRSARRVSRTTASAVGRSRSSSSAATNASWSAATIDAEAARQGRGHGRAESRRRRPATSPAEAGRPAARRGDGGAHGPSAGGGPSARSRARSDASAGGRAGERGVGVVQLAAVARGQREVAEGERVEATSDELGHALEVPGRLGHLRDRP